MSVLQIIRRQCAMHRPLVFILFLLSVHLVLEGVSRYQSQDTRPEVWAGME